MSCWDIESNRTIMGFNIDELILFATTCRELGIRVEDVTDGIKIGYDLARKELNEMLSKSVKDTCSVVTDIAQEGGLIITTGSCTITKAVLKTKVPIMRVYHGAQHSVIVPTFILDQLQEAYMKLFKKERGNRYE